MKRILQWLDHCSQQISERNLFLLTEYEENVEFVTLVNMIYINFFEDWSLISFGCANVQMKMVVILAVDNGYYIKKITLFRGKKMVYSLSE